MDFRFIAGFSVITSDAPGDRRLFVETFGLPLHPPPGAAGSDYLSSDDIPGAKHFGVWPLAEAAQACFGQRTWPDSHPVPQATVELEVGDLEVAAQELVEEGHQLVHAPRTEPWGQSVARFQTADGLLVGICVTPWLHDDE